MQNLFREIHKNSWLKRVDSRKVLQKVSEQLQFWMYFKEKVAHTKVDENATKQKHIC
jgi:hypothetical protein